MYITVDQGETSYACGGGIISSRYVISAGHCSFGVSFEVIVGRISVDGYRQSDVVRVTNVIRPSNYASLGFNYNDIAVFELEKEVEEVPGYIEYMDIGLTAPRVGDDLVLVGFGMLGPTNQTANAHYRSISVSSDSTCNFATYRPEVTFCSNSSEGYSCPGDSGSPIVVKPFTSAKWILVGINSYGHAGRCGEREPDTAIAKVATMIDFIREQTPLAPPNYQTIDFDLLNFQPTLGVDTTTVAPNAPATPTTTNNCFTCPPGFTHWFDFGYVAPPNGDRCQCIEGTPAPTQTLPTVTRSSASSVSGTSLVFITALLSVIISL